MRRIAKQKRDALPRSYRSIRARAFPRNLASGKLTGGDAKAARREATGRWILKKQKVVRRVRGPSERYVARLQRQFGARKWGPCPKTREG